MAMRVWLCPGLQTHISSFLPDDRSIVFVNATTRASSQQYHDQSREITWAYAWWDSIVINDLADRAHAEDEAEALDRVLALLYSEREEPEWP